MTIQEAIEHCEEKIDCSPCGQEHGRLVDWLNELVQYKDTGLTPEEIMDGKMLTGWIPVAERLPDDNCDVLVTNGMYVYEDCYDPTDGYFEQVDNVVAWMPLPEPYRTED